MEILNPQSQSLPPQTNALPMGPPAAAGGNPIIQGFSNLAHGLLAYQQYQQQQQQANQIDAASKRLNAVTEQLDTKQDELKNRQRANPVDPLLLNTEYQTFVRDTVTKAMNDPAIADMPFLRKYLDTHLAPLAHSARRTFATYTDATWGNWHEFQTLANVDTATKSGAAAGARGDLEGQALQRDNIYKELLGNVATGTMSAEKADAILQKSKVAMIDTEVRTIAASQSRDLVEAELAGNPEEFWRQRGHDSSKFDATLRDAVRSIAHDNVTLQATNASKEATAASAQLEQYHGVVANDWYARQIPHQDTTGKMVPAETPEHILAELGTARAKAQLGPHYHAVLAHYQIVASQKAKGNKPDVATYGGVILDIIQGKLPSETAVVKEAIKKGFDVPSLNEAVAQYHNVRTYFEGGAQQKITEAVKVINGKFDWPTSQLIDPAKASVHRTQALTEFYLLSEHVRETMTPQEARNFDWIGRAQVLSDNQFERMFDGVIKILPAAAPDVSVTDAERDYVDKKISKHQFDSILQSHESYNRLQAITEINKKKIAAEPKDPLRAPLYK